MRAPKQLHVDLPKGSVGATAPTHYNVDRKLSILGGGRREALTKLIQEKKVDATFLITHRSTKLEDGPDLYKMFKEKKDGCVKVVFHPGG
jgi:threonine dehydrogenase-like Zn-dependent dehydrogenase